jgi:membrane carboxypeptidase/penicillin-binding protein PbpC
MSNIGVWLATSPLGGAFKAALGAVLVWFLDNASSLNLPAVAQVAIVAGIPVLINALNPDDPRYGNAKDASGVSD